MESAFKVNNKTLLDFMINEVNRSTYIIDLINIIIKLCEILEIYQNACCFVHHDFHLDNIIISYSYDIENKISFNIKIIDISSESSIIIKYKNKFILLKNYGIWYSRTVESINPFLSGMWNKFDLFYFISFILFNKKMFLVNKKLPINNPNFLKFINIILAIFNLNNNYNKILNSINKNTTRRKYLSLVASKEKEKLFNDKTNAYLFFIPSFLKNFLEQFVKSNILSQQEKTNNFIPSISKFREKYLEEYNKNKLKIKIPSNKYNKKLFNKTIISNNMENNIPIQKFKY
jgi:hypothetical protein